MYPRLTEDGQLVSEEQVVGVREHLATKHRIVSLEGQITGDLGASNMLLTLSSLSQEPIKMMITSPGGDLDSTFLLYDTMRLSPSPIFTLGRYCASAAALILAAGSKRYLMPHAKVMLHLPSGQLFGDAKDWDIQHKEMQKYKNTLVDLLCESGIKRSRAEVLNDIDRDFWLEAEAAIEYGLADEIMSPETMKEWLR